MNISLSAAKLVLHEVLSQWRYNGFALVHYGFVLKNLDQDYENAVLYLREGIETNEEGTQDGRFYFNLGDALQRLGRNEEAQKVSFSFKLHLTDYKFILVKSRFTGKVQKSAFSYLNTKDHFTMLID